MCTRWPFLLLLLLPVVPALAGTTVYKCVDARGQVTYQDKPCHRHVRQQVLHIAPTPATASSTSTPVAVAAPPMVKAPTPPPRTMAVVPAPILFRCTRATDGTTYLSRSGQARSYLVPLGMLDRAQPLARTYGSAQGAGVGMSAPELMPDPTPSMIGGGYYVRVRDTCSRLPRMAACKALHKQNEANEAAITRAFSEQRPGLLKRRKELHAQLTGCP